MGFIMAVAVDKDIREWILVILFRVRSVDWSCGHENLIVMNGYPWRDLRPMTPPMIISRKSILRMETVSVPVSIA